MSLTTFFFSVESNPQPSRQQKSKVVTKTFRLFDIDYRVFSLKFGAKKKSPKPWPCVQDGAVCRAPRA